LPAHFLFDDPCGFNKINGIIIMFFQTGGDGKNVGVKILYPVDQSQPVRSIFYKPRRKYSLFFVKCRPWPFSSKAITTTEAPYILHISAC
jgi:hypothetical protein